MITYLMVNEGIIPSFNIDHTQIAAVNLITDYYVGRKYELSDGKRYVLEEIREDGANFYLRFHNGAVLVYKYNDRIKMQVDEVQTD